MTFKSMEEILRKQGVRYRNPARRYLEKKYPNLKGKFNYEKKK